VTGIGQANARQVAAAALVRDPPSAVLTCGFAGGLVPELTRGQVVFDADPGFPGTPRLIAAGARPTRFHCAEEVVATAGAKRALHQATGAEAVEMESGVIRRLCREAAIPSATVRVISDGVDQDLPLDFSRYLDRAMRLRYARLTWDLVRAPARVKALWAFQRELRRAAERLAEAVAAVVGVSA
jgi:adenosylhomocysteine nucleosidase